MNVEHRTSNVQRRMKNEYPIPNIQRLFLFLFSRFDIRSNSLFIHLFPFNIRCWTFDVRCSFFSVNLPQSIRCKNNLALMGGRGRPGAGSSFGRILCSSITCCTQNHGDHQILGLDCVTWTTAGFLGSLSFPLYPAFF